MCFVFFWTVVIGFKAEESFLSLLFLGPSAKRFTVQRSAVPDSLRRPFRRTMVDVSKTSNSNNQSFCRSAFSCRSASTTVIGQNKRVFNANRRFDRVDESLGERGRLPCGKRGDVLLQHPPPLQPFKERLCPFGVRRQHDITARFPVVSFEETNRTLVPPCAAFGLERKAPCLRATFFDHLCLRSDGRAIHF